MAGYRGLMLDSCMCDTSTLTQAGLEFAAEFLGISGGEDGGSGETEKVYEVGFCHTYCNAGIRSPQKVFANIHRFLESNPNEVSKCKRCNDHYLYDLYFRICNPLSHSIFLFFAFHEIFQIICWKSLKSPALFNAISNFCISSDKKTTRQNNNTIQQTNKQTNMTTKR